MTDENRAVDLLGVKGVSDAIKIATARFIDGAAAFLSRVCLPAAEELGLALRDRVSAWRAKNATQMLSMANEIHLKHQSDRNEKVNPRLAHVAIEEASWSDEEKIQRMWAGLLASSGSPDGASDENLMFMNVLKQLSSLQVKILLHAVEAAKKYSTPNGLPLAQSLSVSTEDLPGLFGIADINRIDRELDHLVNVGLIGYVSGRGGINVLSNIADLTPTALALHLYVRAQGAKVSPTVYWDLKVEQTVDGNAE